MRICIASPDILGPVNNGGVGTACTALAQALVRAGHDVTLFYTSTYFERGDREHWRSEYERMGIRLLYLAPDSLPPVHRSPTVYDEDNIARAYHVYEALKESDFDVIHFADYIGLGYFVALGKSQGLCLPRTKLVVTAHSPTLWSRLSNNRPVDDLSYLVRDRMERGLIALCDAVISPSRYMLDWLRDNGFGLPARQCVIPNLMPQRLTEQPAPPVGGEARGIEEIVFFGRLEARKGLAVFCDAIDRVRDELPPAVRISFLGKLVPEFPRAMLEARAARWGRELRILPDFDTFAATDYLRQPGRLAVLAALSDNSPYTVLECLHHRIPFIASDVGGVAELIAPESRACTLFKPVPASLAARLLEVLQRPAGFAPALPAPALARAETDLLALHADWAREAAPERPAPPAPGEAPLVSVTILHHERPRELAQALAALEAQTYRAFEIIVVDNGSRSAEARAGLDRLEAEGGGRLRVLRLPENLYEPEARNRGAEAARGRYVLFMDDDNVPKPNELELFCQAAERGGADILTCFTDHFTGEAPPASAAEALKRFVVMGDFGPLGLICNGYGDLNCFVRRERFLEIGGFIVDGRFNHAEDWRFFAKAWSRGLRIDVLPEALLWYRAAPPGQPPGWRKRDRNGALMRAATAYLEVAPPETRPFLLLSQGLFWKGLETERARRQREAELLQLRRENERLAARTRDLQIENENLRKNYTSLAGAVIGLFGGREGDDRISRILRQVRYIHAKYQDARRGAHPHA